MKTVLRYLIIIIPQNELNATNTFEHVHPVKTDQHGLPDSLVRVFTVQVKDFDHPGKNDQTGQVQADISSLCAHIWS